MTRTIRRLAATAALLIAGIPGMAAAQFQVVGYGSGEWDAHNTAVYVLGVAGQTTNLGLGPAVNVLFYDVKLPNDESIQAINPQAGLQYRWTNSSLQGRVGYVFVRGDTLQTTGATAFGGSRSGLSTTAQYEYWDTGDKSLEVIGNMNWGDKYWWTTANAGVRVARMSNGGLSVGGEVVAQGNSDSQVFQVGPRAELSMGPVKINGVVGYKIRNDLYDNGPYFKLGFVIIP